MVIEPEYQGVTLVLGASGMIGQRLISRLGLNNVIATYNHRQFTNGVHFNARVTSLNELPLELDRISTAVILLGDTVLDSVAADPVRSHVLNVTAISEIIDQPKIWGIRPIFTSTEVVYDGTDKYYGEKFPPNPIVLYGQQKVEIENQIQAKFSEYTDFRVARIYRENCSDGAIFNDWAEKILSGEGII